MANDAPWIQYVDTFRPPNSAMSYAYESEMLAWRPMLGPGIAARFQFASIFPQAQSYQAVAAIWNTGLGGLAHGQSVLQPLSNPYG